MLGYMSPELIPEAMQGITQDGEPTNYKAHKPLTRTGNLVMPVHHMVLFHRHTGIIQEYRPYPSSTMKRLVTVALDFHCRWGGSV